VWNGESLEPFYKKGALFWKEKRPAWIDHELSGIRLHFREIRMRGSRHR
jgi:hypothetical protein